MNTLEKILQLISDKGINEQKFLGDLDFNRTLLCDWKSGKSKSYKKHVDKIAEYFNVSTDYLLGTETISLPPMSDKDLETVKMFNSLADKDRQLVLDLMKSMQK